MEMVVEVIGVKAFKGVIDGKQIDSGTLYSIVRLDDRYNRKDDSGTNWKSGFAMEEWKLPNSEVAMRMMQFKPSIKNPVSVRLEIERVSNGREATEIIVDAYPVSAPIVDQQTGEIRSPVKKAA